MMNGVEQSSISREHLYNKVVFNMYNFGSWVMLM